MELGEIGDVVRHCDSERLLVPGRFLEQIFGPVERAQATAHSSDRAGSSQHDKKSA